MTTSQRCTHENPLRILHISDLHFGFRFNTSNWSNLQERAKKLDPQLVIVTGDLVNTPWVWMLGSVRKQLVALSAALNGAPIWAIAGNHDTRISGVVPVRWLWWISLGFLVIAAVMLGVAHYVAIYPLWLKYIVEFCGWVALIVGLSGALLRILVHENFAAKLGDPYYLNSPKVIEGTKVGIVPIDSASADVSFARGRVALEQLANLRFAIDRCEKSIQQSPLVWIAAVHHHPLPLPYDDAAERMMVMDNAGALLSELSDARVRLVLHGHKHHAHFARITVDPTSQPEHRELAVLSAGTPTERRNPGAYWHNFNLIEVDGANRIRITMYKAAPNGGSFKANEPFDFVPIKQQSEWRFEDNAARLKLKCRGLLLVAHINSYGDVRFSSEYRGLKTEEKNLGELPGYLRAKASAGVIEAFIAKPLSNFGPTVRAQLQRHDASYIEAKLKFSPGLQSSHQPIDFMTQFHANNAIALNKWQAENMYSEARDRDSVMFRVPEAIAVEEAILQVWFADDIPLPQRFDARVSMPETGGEFTTVLAADDLVRMYTQNTVQICVRHPTPGSCYEISWDLGGNAWGASDRKIQLQIQKALSLRKRLGICSSTDIAPQMTEKLRNLLNGAELTAREYLASDPDKASNGFHACLFRFDEATKSLCYLIGNHADGDPRQKGEYKFGLGLPGRAFKSGDVVAFQRPLYSPDEQPWMYLHPNGDPVTPQSSAMVKEVAALAFPLAPPEAPGWVYAVLQISTDDLNSPLKTTNTTFDSSVEAYRIAINALCIETLGETLDP